MLTELPFFCVNDSDLLKLLNIEPCSNFSNNLTSEQSFRNCLYTLSKEPLLKSLDTAYYTSDEFINKARRDRINLELSIFHVNIHSLNAKHLDLCMFIDLLDIEFDVLILSEIWSYNIEFYNNIFDGYSFYYELPKTSSVGGVGMYIRKNMFCKNRYDLHLQSSSNLQVENLWFEIRKNKRRYIIGGIYRHPHGNIEAFSEKFELTLGKISRKKTPSVIAGDININLLQVEINKTVEKYVNILFSNNFLPVILLPTRITAVSSTLIDHIYYYQGRNNTRQLGLRTGNLLSDLSDHLPVFSFLSNVSSRINLKDRPLIRLFTNSNKLKFKHCLSNIEWSNILYNNNNVNECYNNFISAVTEHYEICFPLTRQSRRACREKKRITKGLRICSRRKEKLFKKWILSKNDVDKINYLAYKKNILKL